MVQRPVVIVGGGPAGLSVGSALSARGVSAVVLEKGTAVGTSWRNHYDRLHLHTPRGLSHLPGLKIPASEGRWVSRDGVVRYLENLADHHRLEVRTSTSVASIDRNPSGASRWIVRADTGDLEADTVVVATGYNHTPYIPEWPGLDSFTGEVVHASRYRTGATYAGRHVLVVGAGNTGAEIAVDLSEQGAAEVWLAYRRPPYIMQRSSLGVSTTRTGVLLRHVPAPIADLIAEPVRKMQPNLTSKGFPDPGKGIYTRAKRGEIPILDVGLVKAVQADLITPVPEVVGFDGSKALLADDRRIDPDVVVVAAGYRRGLESLVGHLGVLAESGRPRAHGAVTLPDTPGLHFIGYTNPVSGMFREINHDARRIARALTR